jgi:hypothetical protein
MMVDNCPEKVSAESTQLVEVQAVEEEEVCFLA